MRAEHHTLRSEVDELRKNLRAYDELIATKDAELAAIRKQVVNFEKGKENELDRLKTKLIDMGDQVSNALKFQEVSSNYFRFATFCNSLMTCIYLATFRN